MKVLTRIGNARMCVCVKVHVFDRVSVEQLLHYGEPPLGGGRGSYQVCPDANPVSPSASDLRVVNSERLVQVSTHTALTLILLTAGVLRAAAAARFSSFSLYDSTDVVSGFYP